MPHHAILYVILPYYTTQYHTGRVWCLTCISYRMLTPFHLQVYIHYRHRQAWVSNLSYSISKVTYSLPFLWSGMLLEVRPRLWERKCFSCC